MSHPPPRVVHVLHSDGGGGGPVIVARLLEGLHRDFAQVVCSSGRGRAAEKCASLGIPFHNLRFIPVWKSPLGFMQLFRLLRSIRPDVVMLHGQWAGPIGALASLQTVNTTGIYVAHCPAFYHSTTLWRAVRNYIAELIPCRLCKSVVTLSEGNYYNYLFRSWAPENRLIKIPNGVNPLAAPDIEQSRSVRTAYGFDPQGRHAVFVGRIDDQKRVDWLLEAWSCALKTKDAGSPASPAWHLWIVGDGRERGRCESIAAQHGLSASVHFVGSQPEGLPWLAAADVVVMSSLYEGHALVPLEAMSCAKPVVAFVTDGIVDSVVHEETGLLANLGDTRMLGKYMAELLADEPRCRRLGLAGKSRVCEFFTEQQMLDRYRGLLRRLLPREENQAAHLVADQ